MDEEEQEQEEEEKTRQLLQLEVSELESVLDREKRLGRILRHCSLHAAGGGRRCRHYRCCLSAMLPAKIRGLLAELAMVEEEICYLEKKVEDLRTRLYRERNWNDHCLLLQQRQTWLQQNRRLSGFHGGDQQLPQRLLPCPGNGDDEEDDLESQSKTSAGRLSVSEQGDEVVEEQSRRSSHSFDNLRLPERRRRIICSVNPNKLSEELVRLTITIFHKLNNTTPDHDELISSNSSSSAPKLIISSCIGSSRSLVPKPSSSSSSPAPAVENRGATLPEECGGCGKGLVEFTRSSFDASRVSLCLADIKNLRVLMNRLSTVDPSLLTNKQKLAFWINIYNFCVMHAFLQHGLPPSPEKLLALLNQASVKVGGTVLSVVSIEHLFLRHHSSPDQSKQGMMTTMLEEAGDLERDLQLRYGLGFPEPNVVFALCRGSRSSPAVGVYTAEEVSSELEQAKVRYLERCVRVVRRKKKKAKGSAMAVVLPKLLHWHMRCFADDVESLLEWVHSQLGESPALKRAIRDVLLLVAAAGGDRRGKPPQPPALEKMVEIEPYDAEFCYLLPVC